MNDDLPRARAFEEAVRERGAERTVSFEWGCALFNETYDRVWELNVLRVDRPDGLTVEALVAEADRLQGGAGLPHRRIVVLDEAAGAALEPRFKEVGWQADRFVYMAARRRPARTADASAVREVERAALRPLRETIIRAEPWGKTDEVVRQLGDASGIVAEAARARHFAVVVDGVAVAAADLYSDGRIAQIEDVATMPDQRGRGYATAVVLRALEEARNAGHELTFLIADENDWPKELYARLGFDPIGRKFAFLKPPRD
jgi:ribosomal protein S18 acetylase RimI-like enzyme